MTFDQYIYEAKKRIEQRGIEYLEQQNLAPKLKEAMLYSFTAGGKRLRPLLMLSVLHLFQVPIDKGLNTAVAIEFIHTSSLIHDDLPAMDNDDLRRGKPTNHKVFGEATAILAGDALILQAFELIASDPNLEDSIKTKLVLHFSRATGANGMVGGQQLDIENEDKPLTLEELMTINENKTGQLITFSLFAGGLIAEVDSTIIDQIEKASRHLGLAFQIQDDVLDVIGDRELLGKETNQDEKNNKTTYVSVLGIEGAKKAFHDHYVKAFEALKRFCSETSFLHQLLKQIIERKY